MVGTIVTAVAAGVVKLWLEGKPSTPSPLPWAFGDAFYSHRINISNWRGDTLQKWTAKSPPKADVSWIRPTGATLYNVVPKATRGLLVFTSFLAEYGQAKFLLGSDSEVSNAFVVTLTNTREELEMNAAHLLNGKLTQFQGGIRTWRNNESLHNDSIKFDGDSITTSLGNSPTAGPASSWYLASSGSAAMSKVTSEFTTPKSNWIPKNKNTTPGNSNHRLV